MLNTLSNLKRKWPRGLPTFWFKFFSCVVPFPSLKLSRRFVAGIRLPHAKVNEDLVELLHPKVTLFFSISRQPVPRRQGTLWIILHLQLVIVTNVKLINHRSPEERAGLTVKSTFHHPATKPPGISTSRKQLGLKVNKTVPAPPKTSAFKWHLHH